MNNYSKILTFSSKACALLIGFQALFAQGADIDVVTLRSNALKFLMQLPDRMLGAEKDRRAHYARQESVFRHT